MIEINLAEVADVFNGKTPSKAEQRTDGHPVLKIKNVSENQKFKGVFDSFVDDELKTKFKHKLIKLNDTLILNAAHNADYVGSKQYCAELDVVDSLPTGEWLIARSKDLKLDSVYLNFWLRLDYTRVKIRHLVKGIHLYPKDVARLKIPLPPLAEQQKIAAILDAADSLRQKDQQLIDHYTTLSQSLFLELFGDPVTNPMGWKENSLGDLFSALPRIGTTRPASDDGKIKVVRVGEIGKKEISFNKCGKVLLSSSEKDRFILKYGDIILARAIGSIHHLGKASLFLGYKNDVVFDSHVMRVRFKNERINPSFYYHWMLSNGGRAIFLKNSGQTAVQFNINSKQISGIRINTPPIKLQDQFAEKMKDIEAQKKQAQASLEKSNDLFNSLLQRAFKAELSGSSRFNDNLSTTVGKGELTQ